MKVARRPPDHRPDCRCAICLPVLFEGIGGKPKLRPPRGNPNPPAPHVDARIAFVERRERIAAAERRDYAAELEHRARVDKDRRLQRFRELRAAGVPMSEAFAQVETEFPEE